MRSEAAEKGTDCAQLFLTMQARALRVAPLARACLRPQPALARAHARSGRQACMSANASEFAAFGAELAANEEEHAAAAKQAKQASG